MTDIDSIAERARALSPWRLKVELAPGLWTSDCNRVDESDPDKMNVAVIDPREIIPFFNKYYPGGLTDKDVLDVACNSGGYSFLARELGARSVTGFDIREHWIEQARFIKSIKYPTDISISFKKRDASMYFKKAKKQYDIIIFKGILYYLPDPINILMGYCDLARDAILIDSVCSYEIPEQCFAAVAETGGHMLSGVRWAGVVAGRTARGRADLAAQRVFAGGRAVLAQLCRPGARSISDRRDARGVSHVCSTPPY